MFLENDVTITNIFNFVRLFYSPQYICFPCLSFHFISWFSWSFPTSCLSWVFLSSCLGYIHACLHYSDRQFISPCPLLRYVQLAHLYFIGIYIHHLKGTFFSTDYDRSKTTRECDIFQLSGLHDNK